MKESLKIIILFCLICNSCTNDIEEEREKNNEIRIQKEVAIVNSNPNFRKSILGKVLPFTNPKTINEILESVYIVDTLFIKAVQNDIGNDDDEYLIIFNKIIGKASSIEERPNQILPMKRIEYFDPVFIRKNKDLIIPFYSDNERENTIFTIWSKNGNEFEFKDYINKLFITKYSKIRIIDELTKNEISYLLIEEYSPDEAELSRNLSLVKLTPTNELSLIKFYQLGIIDTDTIIPKCYLKYEKSKLSIIKEVNILSEEDTIRIKLIDELEL